MADSTTKAERAKMTLIFKKRKNFSENHRDM
jgi:hypothetical protein